MSTKPPTQPHHLSPRSRGGVPGRRRLLAVSALAVLLGAALAGCGGSGSGTTEATVALHPMAEWDAHSAHDKSSGKMHMNASEMKEMKSGEEGLPYVATGAHGEAFFKQVGDHLTGWRRVTGLVPFSGHADHLHGPDGACSPKSKQTSNMAVVLPDLVANAKGEAYGTVDLVVHQRVVGPGYFVIVHAKPTPASQRNQIGSAPASMAFMQAMSNDPAMLCGNVTVKS